MLFKSPKIYFTKMKYIIGWLTVELLGFISIGLIILMILSTGLSIYNLISGNKMLDILKIDTEKENNLLKIRIEFLFILLLLSILIGIIIGFFGKRIKNIFN